MIKLVLSVLCVTTALQAADTAVPATAPASAAEVAALVRQLDHDEYAKREAATKRLLTLGAAAATELKAALRAGRLELEGRTRAGYILALVDVPDCGAVWRGASQAEQDTSEGQRLKEGDVVIASGGSPIRCWSDIAIALQGESEMEFTCWRRGEGQVSIVLPQDGNPAALGFQTWPDELELFDRLAKSDKYDQRVRQAIRWHYAGNAGAAGAFAQVWKDGCRSALVPTMWLTELLAAGDLKQARQVFQEQISGQKLEDSAGGLWQYGMLPYQLAKLEIAQGNGQAAADVLARAMTEAQKASASQAVDCLRYAQAEMKVFFDDPAEALKFWQANAESINRINGMFGSDLAVVLAGRLAAASSPADALKFIDTWGDCPAKKSLKEYYTAQAELASQAAAEAGQKRHMVLLSYQDDLQNHKASLDHYWVGNVGQLRTAGRLVVQMRIVSFPPEWSPMAKMVSVSLSTNDEQMGASSMRLRLDSAGKVSTYESVAPAALRQWSPRMLASSQWHELTIDVLPGGMSASIDGKAWRRTYASPSGQWKADVSCAGAEAEFRDIALYVGSAVEIDNKLVLEQLKAFSAARHACDLKAAQAAAAKLAALWEKAPEAAEAVANLRGQLRDFEAFMSPEGLALCTADMLKQAKYEEKLWRLEGDRLIGSCLEQRQPVLTVTAPFRNFEISGKLEIDTPGQNTGILIAWGSADTYSSPNMMGYWVPAKVANLSISKGEASKMRSPLENGFYLRVRGDKAMVLAGGGKRSGTLEGITYPGDKMVLYTINLPQGAQATYTGLRIRHLDDNVKLSDPPGKLSAPGQ